MPALRCMKLPFTVFARRHLHARRRISRPQPGMPAQVWQVRAAGSRSSSGAVLIPPAAAAAVPMSLAFNARPCACARMFNQQKVQYNAAAQKTRCMFPPVCRHQHVVALEA